MTTPRIVILGPQGAGKGTQAALLARHFHIPHISAGDLLRAEARRGTALGQKIARIIDRGRLVPDALMSLVVRHRLARADARRGWILDGYPRFRAQAASFNRFARPTIVIHLTLTDREAIRRLAGRRVCPNGHVYHLRHQRPKKRPGVCDIDGLPLHRRADDTPTAIRKRLAWHHAQTDPLIASYRRRHELIEVNAAPRIPLVYRQVLQQIKTLPWLSSRLQPK